MVTRTHITKESIKDEYFVVDAEDFGVIVGTGNESANDIALKSLRTHLVTDRDVHWIVNFPPGLIVYTWNRWLAQVGRVVVNAHGTEFRNTSESSMAWQKRPLETSHFFLDEWDHSAFGNAGNTDQESGKLINTVSAGSTTITTATALDAGHVEVGKWALVHGYEQQGSGFPANLRYFQYVKITSVDTGTGQIGIDRPLYHDFEASWIDRITNSGSNNTGNYGAPRILNLERGDAKFNIPLEVIINGGNWTSTSGDRTFWVRCGIYVEINSAECDRMSVGSCDVHVANRVIHRHTTTALEMDKMTNVCIFNDCQTMGGLNNGLGFNKVIFNRGAILGGEVRPAPRQLEYNGVLFGGTSNSSGNTILGLGDRPLDNWTMRGCRFARTSDKAHLIERLSNKMLTVSSVPSGTTIQVDTPSDGLINSIEYGQTLYNLTEGNSGQVTSITFDASSNILIGGTWKVVSATDVIEFNRLQQFENEGNLFPVDFTDTTSYLYGLLAHEGTRHLGKGIYRTTLKPKDIDFTGDDTDDGITQINCFAKILEIQVNILKAYAGTSANTPNLRFRYQTGEESSLNFLDIRVEGSNNVGIRKLTPYGKEDQSGSTFDDPAADTSRLLKYISELQINTQNMPGTDAEMPQVEIELVWRQF